MVQCGSLTVEGFELSGVSITNCSVTAPEPFDPHGSGDTFSMTVEVRNEDTIGAEVDITVTAGGTTLQTDRGVTVPEGSSRTRNYQLGGFGFPLDGGDTYTVEATLSNITENP